MFCFGFFLEVHVFKKGNKNPHFELCSFKDVDCRNFFNETPKWKKKSPENTHNTTPLWSQVQILIVKKKKSKPPTGLLVSNDVLWGSFISCTCLSEEDCNHSNSDGKLCNANSVLQFYTVSICLWFSDIIIRTAEGAVGSVFVSLTLDASYLSCAPWAGPTFDPDIIVGSCYRRISSVTLSTFFRPPHLVLLLPSRLNSCWCLHHRFNSPSKLFANISAFELHEEYAAVNWHLIRKLGESVLQH